MRGKINWYKQIELIEEQFTILKLQHIENAHPEKLEYLMDELDNLVGMLDEWKREKNESTKSLKV